MKLPGVLILCYLAQLRLVRAGIWYYGDDNIDPITGMTDSEKSSVKSTWNYMMKDPDKYGSMILKKYFQKYPDYLGYFPYPDLSSEDFTDHKDFKVYLNLMMYTLGSIIDNLQNNPTVMTGILRKLGKNHFKNNVEAEPFWNLRDLILDIIQPMVNAHTYKSWEKFLNIAMDYITSSMDNESYNVENRYREAL